MEVGAWAVLNLVPLLRSEISLELRLILTFVKRYCSLPLVLSSANLGAHIDSIIIT